MALEDVALAVGLAFWFLLPAYAANPMAVVFGGGTPMDFGRTLLASLYKGQNSGRPNGKRRFFALSPTLFESRIVRPLLVVGCEEILLLVGPASPQRSRTRTGESRDFLK